MTRAEMERHAEAWIAAWNRRDIDCVLEDFVPGVRFVSPTAAAVVGHPVVEGKPALERYWRAAVQRYARLEFRLDYALCDEVRREMVVVYERTVDGAQWQRACEFMRFDAQGRQVAGEALYGAQLA
jgi:hypothetical protein